MSLVRKVKLLALVSILTMTSVSTAYAKTDNKQTTTTKKDSKDNAVKQAKGIKKVLKDLGLDTQDQSQPMGTAPQQSTQQQPTQSTPTASTAQPGTAQYCFDNKLPLNQITAENCTKRLTQDEWYKLLPHTKGKNLSYRVEHCTPVVIHIPNIDSNWTSLHDGTIMAVWKNDAYDKVATFSPSGTIRAGDVYTYFKDGTYVHLENIPKDKDLDDISFITFPILTKDDNPLQVLLFPDHIEQTLIKGKDGVPLFNNK